MNGESSMAAASVAMRLNPNQLELVSFSPPLPGLVAGKLAHIWILSSKSCITGRSSAPGSLCQPCRWMFAPA